MNSPFVIDHARYAADRLLDDDKLDDSGRILLAYRRALGRRPTDREQSMALQYVNDFQADDEGIEDPKEAWASFCHSLFASLDFRYAD